MAVLREHNPPGRGTSRLGQLSLTFKVCVFRLKDDEGKEIQHKVDRESID